MKRKYDSDFKRNTVQKVLDGQPAASIAWELGIGENLIYRLKRIIRQNGNGTHSSTELNEGIPMKERENDARKRFRNSGNTKKIIKTIKNPVLRD